MSEEQPNVSPDAKNADGKLPKAPEVTPGEKSDNNPEPVKTPANELYAGMQEERLKRKEAEKALEAANKELEEFRKQKAQPGETEPEHSEEGLRLMAEIERLEGVVTSLRERTEIKDVLDKYPVLNDHLVEFDEFREGYQGLPLDKVAMVFLAEKGALVEKKVVRPGLEQPSGGPQQAPTQGMSVEEVQRLRNEDPKRYIKMIRKGQIKPSQIQRKQ